MSPLRTSETATVMDMAATFRRWGDLLEVHTQLVGDQDVGPEWGDDSLTELYEAWLDAGRAIRDVVRSRPHESSETRAEVVALRDGLRRITAVLERQAPR
jgi:hypothetical protein